MWDLNNSQKWEPIDPEKNKKIVIKQMVIKQTNKELPNFDGTTKL